MKKFTLIFIALVGFAWSVSAQNTTNKLTADVDIPNSATGASEVLKPKAGESYTMPYYVAPDSYFNPDWVTNHELSDLTVFNWDFAGLAAGVSKQNENDNYVELKFTDVVTTGSFVIKVAEKTVASGGCGDATPSELTITVLDRPTAADAGDDQDVCSNADGTPAVAITDKKVTFTTEANPSIRVLYSVVWVNQTWNGTDWVDGSVNEVITHNTIATIEKLGQAVTELNMSTGVDYLLKNNQRTVYKHVLDGFTTRLTRKCNYMINKSADEATFVNELAAPMTVSLVAINPTPATGAIYHVKNDWSVN